MKFYLLKSIIDWKMFFLGGEEWEFLAETFLRSLIMFIVLLTGLRLLGKRGVKQLSVFELVVIIGLGSAAGDPMFYKDVGLLPAILVFVMVIGLYRFVTHLVNKSKKIERLIEGMPVCLIENGRFAIENFEKETVAQDEFFAELRMASVMHLGQVEKAYIETTGSISIYFYPDDEVKFGLPILPQLFNEKYKQVTKENVYACTFCGNVKTLIPSTSHTCPVCKKDQWVEAINRKRIR
ncbi:MAG: YetF domain-containing protein [Bacteroidota bacterium]